MYATKIRKINRITLPKMCGSIAADPEALSIRQKYLDDQILNSPSAAAQEITSRAIHQLMENAPWLLPDIING